MNAIIWGNHPKYAVSNRELWKQFFETSSVEEQEYLLLLILTNAKDNNERWDVFSESKNTSTKEEALFSMLPYVSTFNELRKMVTHTTDDMWEVRERMIMKALTTYRMELSRAKNNRQRWHMHHGMPIEILRTEALSDILMHSTNNGERWKVFFSTKKYNTEGSSAQGDDDHPKNQKNMTSTTLARASRGHSFYIRRYQQSST